MSVYSDRDQDRTDLRQAYELGRRDGRRSRPRHPVLMTFTVIAAVIGLMVLALAAVNGSFSDAGVVVDRNLATAAERAEPVVEDAASQAGAAIRDATDTDRTDSPAYAN